MALKIDIRKSFDKVDRDYLLSVMKKMGLSEKWLRWTYPLQKLIAQVKYIEGGLF